jgi:hypothetical protein
VSGTRSEGHRVRDLIRTTRWWWFDIAQAAWSRTPVFFMAKARQYMKIRFVSGEGRSRNVRW